MTPDQAALLRKAYSSLHAAQLLSRETLFDFSVSRAYYTMVLCGRGVITGPRPLVFQTFGRLGRIRRTTHQAGFCAAGVPQVFARRWR